MGEDNLNLRSMQLYLFRMSPFPCCIFDNIETVNVTKDFQHLSIGIREML